MEITIKRLNKFGNSFKLFNASAARFLLGAFILYKGIFYLQHTDLLLALLHPYDGMMAGLLVYHYVTMGHIAGGVLIIFGMLTRIAVFIQIPILIGAVIANIQLADVNQLVISIFVLAFLSFFAIIGSSKQSVDYNLKMQA